MLLKDKVAVITGAGSGMGKAAALNLANQGTCLVLGNRNTQKGRETADEVNKQGGNAIFQKTDVTVEQNVKDLIEIAVEEYGRLDIAFNNAGILGPIMPLHKITLDDFKKNMEVNSTGVFLCMKYQIEKMLQTGSGVIINNASIYGIKGQANWSAYCASKHSVTALTKSAAVEYANKNIRINAVAPGPVNTPMLQKATKNNPQAAAGYVPLKRIAEPQEIADAVLWLSSDSSSYITGHILTIDGGITLL